MTTATTTELRGILSNALAVAARRGLARRGPSRGSRVQPPRRHALFDPSTLVPLENKVEKQTVSVTGRHAAASPRARVIAPPARAAACFLRPTLPRATVDLRRVHRVDGAARGGLPASGDTARVRGTDGRAGACVRGERGGR
jgi:hypothetical protein